MATAPQKRVRLSIDLSRAAQRRISKAAAQRDLSVRQYVLEALQQRLKEDLSKAIARESLLTLSAQTDPVLAELWDNSQDAAYDRL
jgi:uncharacterized protein (DUF1778 family)